jgi:hypothetical protein
MGTTRGLEPLDEVFQRMALEVRAKWNQHQLEMAEYFYSVVEDWNNGLISMEQALGLSWGGFIRLQIIRGTPPNDPHYEILMRFFDASLERLGKPGVQTSVGWFSKEEIERQGGRIREEFDAIRQEVYWVAEFPTGYATKMDGKPDYDRPIFGQPSPASYEITHFEVQPIPGIDEWNKEEI